MTYEESLAKLTYDIGMMIAEKQIQAVQEYKQRVRNAIEKAWEDSWDEGKEGFKQHLLQELGL